MGTEQQPIAVDQAYKILDDKFRHKDCNYAEPVLYPDSEEVLCIGLDIAWFGGSVNDKDSQYDNIGVVLISPHAEQPKFPLTRVRLKNRDSNAVQLLTAVDSLLQEYQEIRRVVFAVDAPIQAVDRELPARSPNPLKGTVERRACENHLDEQRKHLEKAKWRSDDWSPKIQPGAPLAPRVLSLLDGLQHRGFTLWTHKDQRAERLVIECFPAEAIWSIRQLGYYPTSAKVTCVKAYKAQKGILLSSEQVKCLVHDVLDAFAPVTGNTAHWQALVGHTIDQLLSNPTWQVNGYYRGGKFFDDVVDTIICLATSLSYVHNNAHVWNDPQHVSDGHIIGPGFSSDGVWTTACDDYMGSNRV